MKRKIKLTESKLNRIISEAVKRVIREANANFDERQILDDYMMNIRSVRDELGLYMQGYCTINGKTVIKLNQRKKDSHTSLGFSLDDNGELEMHLIEDSTNSDIMEPIKVPSDFEGTYDMYGLLSSGLEALWQYECGFYYKDDDAETQWDLNNTMYRIMNRGVNRHLSNAPDQNLNVRDWHGSEAMNAMGDDNIDAQFARRERPDLTQRRQNFRNKLYRKRQQL